MRAEFVTIVLTLAICAAAAAADSQPAQQKVILDTDIGDDVDDAYALALLASLPNARILGVTTSFGETGKRAELAAKLLKVLGRPNVPVYAGRPNSNPIRRQYEWAHGYKSRSIKPEGAAEFMKREIERAPGEVTIVPVGALTNIGDLLTKYPQVKGKIKQIVIMGGAVHSGYGGGPVTPEWNIKCDPGAARTVFGSGVPVVMAGLEVTSMMQLDPERQKRLFAKGTPTTDALAALTNLWGNGVPTLFDPVAVAHALGHSFCDMEQRHVVVEDDGLTRITDGPPNVTVLIKPRKDAFLDWYVAMVK